jgi:hypothetical protein
MRLEVLIVFQTNIFFKKTFQKKRDETQVIRASKHEIVPDGFHPG